MAASSTASSAALPQQLTDLMIGGRIGDVAPCVASFSEMAPGIPWSTPVLEEMLENGVSTLLETVTTGRDGSRISVEFLCGYRKVKKEHIKDSINVQVTTEFDGVENSLYRHGLEEFPHTVVGLRHAIEHGQRVVNKLKRKGYCECWKQQGRYPVKRLRVGETDRCTKCILKSCFEQ